MENPSKRSKTKKEVDLKAYRETEFVSKNLKLKDLFDQLVNGHVELNEPIHRALTTNNYKWFDEFVLAHAGIDNFYEILKQLFLFKYFLPYGMTPLTRKQFQNALGIQQVRWSTDAANTTNTTTVAPLTMHVYQDFVTDPHGVFNRKLIGEGYMGGGILRRDKMYPEFAAKSAEQQREDVTRALQDTIWYSFSKDDYLRFYASQDIFWLKADNDATDPARGLSSSEAERLPFNYFPLPEMMWNLSDMACFHTPELIFGVLTAQTLTKFIVRNSTRPYHMHLAGERPNLNLQEADGVKVMIEMFWTHDMQHERLGNCEPETNFRFLNEKLTRFCRYRGIDCTEVTAENIQNEFENPESVLNKFIDSHRNAEGQKVSVNSFLLMNDEPAPWYGRPPRFGGTKRRARHRKSRRKKKLY